MNNYLHILCSLLIMNFSCNQKKISKKKSIVSENKYQEIDSVFFKSQNIFSYNDWIISNKAEGNVLRLYKGEIAKDFFWDNNQNLMHLKLLGFGKLKHPKGTDSKEASFFGKWTFYGDGDMGVYKIGHYKNGIKDSVWYTQYEDYFPMIKYYKDGKSIRNKGDFIITANKIILAQGKEISISGIPTGTWIFHLNDDVQSEKEFIREKDSVTIKYRNINRTSGKIIDSGKYKEPLEDLMDL